MSLNYITDDCHDEDASAPPGPQAGHGLSQVPENSIQVEQFTKEKRKRNISVSKLHYFVNYLTSNASETEN